MNRRESIIASLAGITAVAALTPDTEAQDEKAPNPELEVVRALLKAHDTAMTAQDVKGVLATLAEKPALMGTGPGEIWVGPEEVTAAYEQFFKGFDKGEQKFDYHFKIGDLGPNSGWLMASGNISGKKDGTAFEFPLNLSLTVSKASGSWKITAMHFSTLTGEGKK